MALNAKGKSVTRPREKHSIRTQLNIYQFMSRLLVFEKGKINSFDQNELSLEHVISFEIFCSCDTIYLIIDVIFKQKVKRKIHRFTYRLNPIDVRVQVIKLHERTNCIKTKYNEQKTRTNDKNGE